MANNMGEDGWSGRGNWLHFLIRLNRFVNIAESTECPDVEDDETNTFKYTTMDCNGFEPKLYEIRNSDIMGRYLVATRPIRAGEIIINEQAVAFGPPTKGGPVCLGCYRDVSFSNSQFRCFGCQWPMCGPQCPGRNANLGHSHVECEILARGNVARLVANYDEQQMKIVNEIIFPLRCLYLKKISPAKWSETIALESHNDLRKEIPELWSRNQEKIVDQIRDVWNIRDFTDNEIHTVYGIIRVNCFGLGRLGTKGRALFPITSIMAHDCCPNVRTAIHPRTYRMTVRALRDIQEGEGITTSYVDYILGTMKRREQLRHGKYFWCSCQRCSDPTEFGTYCSALNCLRCCQGIVLPSNPLQQYGQWKCLQCESPVEASTVSAMLDKLFKELESFDPSQTEPLEQFIQRYQRILGENHYLLTLAKYNLTQLYNMSSETTENMLRHRERYCRDVLKNVNVLKPGLSLVRAIVMFNLHIPLISLTRLAFQKQEIGVEVYRSRLQEVVQLLKESEYILKLDPDDAKEQDIARLAKMALVAVTQMLIKAK